MSRIAIHPVPWRHVAVVLLALILALFARAALELELRQHGYADAVAKDIAFLLVPPVLVILLWPVWRAHGSFIVGLFDRADLTIQVFLVALAIGTLARIAWWSQLIAGISFGLYANSRTGAIVGPTFDLACPPAIYLALGFAVMALAVPLIEEVIHRGIVQTAFIPHGAVIAIAASAVIFMLYHRPGSYPLVLAMGIVTGIQFHLSGVLWPSLITHMTYNGLLQLDWRCLKGSWNPPPESLPLLATGSAAILVLFASVASIAWLLVARTGPALSRRAPP